MTYHEKSTDYEKSFRTKMNELYQSTSGPSEDDGSGPADDTGGESVHDSGSDSSGDTDDEPKSLDERIAEAQANGDYDRSFALKSQALREDIQAFHEGGNR